MQFQTDTTKAGLALALGVQEVRPVDLVTAYSTLANGGKNIGHTTILTVKDDRRQGCRRRRTPPPKGTAGGQPAGGLHRHRHPGRQHQPERQPVLGQVRHRRPERRVGRRRSRPARTTTPRTSTPTATSPRRPSRAGRTARTRWPSGSGTATATTRPVSTPARPVFSIDVSTYVWQGFLQEASRKWPMTTFKRPDGLERVAIDPWTGLRATSGGEAVNEWFIAGTEPRDAVPADTCGIEVVRHRRRRDRPRRLDEGRPRTGSAAPRRARGRAAARTGHGRRTSTTGRSGRTARRGAPSSSATAAGKPSPSPVLHPAPDARCERGDPVVRADAVAVRARGRGRSPARRRRRRRRRPRRRRRRTTPTPGDPTPTPDADARRPRRPPRRPRHPTPTPTPTPTADAPTPAP